MKTNRFAEQEFITTMCLNPYWSSFICFAETIWEKNGLSKRTINKAFKKLVDKNDYSKRDRSQILKQLFLLSEGQVF